VVRGATGADPESLSTTRLRLSDRKPEARRRPRPHYALERETVLEWLINFYILSTNTWTKVSRKDNNVMIYIYMFLYELMWLFNVRSLELLGT